MFLTDARELGAREVAPDALLVKLPKKKRKIIKNRTKIERKSLWTLAVTSQCRIHYFYRLRGPEFSLKLTKFLLYSAGLLTWPTGSGHFRRGRYLGSHGRSAPKMGGIDASA